MSLDGDTVEIRAHAKINLHLEVIRRREDGYHDIRSVVVPISLSDRIRIEPAAKGVETVLDDGGLAELEDLRGMSPERALTNRAALALQEATGCRRGVRMRLQKNIPVGGGLGGGSADAAAVLLALSDLWGTGLSRGRLEEIAAGVGSDVAALVHGGAVVMTGRGEKVASVEGLTASGRRGWWLVIANPRIPVSTRDIYSHCRPSLTSADGAFTNTVSSLGSGDVIRASKSLYNGLQPPAVEKYPLIGILLEELQAAGALGALVSGSGASVFGLCANEAEARSVEGRLRQRLGSAVWSYVARTLPDGVMAAHGPLEARV
jgi:4-diphosphocytidyl-2-C-methyl-D-erythritol kinase